MSDTESNEGAGGPAPAEPGDASRVSEVTEANEGLAADDESQASALEGVTEANESLADDDTGPAAVGVSPDEPSPASPVAVRPKAGRPPTPSWLAALQRRSWFKAGQLLLAPLLAAGAVGVHWWLNVPDVIQERAGDQGSKKKKRGKKDKRAKGKARGRADKGKARGRRGRAGPRSTDELAAAWQEYKGTEFEDEPIRAGWARSHQALINRAVVVARRDAFDGAPEQPRIVLASTTCRTVRCRFVLRSPYAHELEVLGSSLERLRYQEQPVWRDFDAVPISTPEGEPSHEHYVRVTVGFQLDDTDSRALTVAEVQEPPPSDEATAPDDSPPRAG